MNKQGVGSLQMGGLRDADGRLVARAPGQSTEIMYQSPFPAWGSDAGKYIHDNSLQDLSYTMQFGH